MTRAALTPVLLIALTVSTADAQTCTGAASFRDHPMQVAGAMASVNRATDIGGTFLASRQALFGGGGVAMSDPEFGSPMTNVIGVIGFEFTNPDYPAFFCPIGQVRFGNGPDFDSLDGSSFVTQAGVSVGLRVWEASNATVIPTFSLLAVYERYTAEITGVQSSASIGSGLLTVGVGFVFDERFAVVPAVHVPFSRGFSSAGFAWSASWNFGG
jgi:hypothetical protein